MAIICYAGQPGAGKSYYTAKTILDNLKLGKKVYTNVDGMDDEDCRLHIKLYTGLDDYQLETQLIYMPPDKCTCFWKTEKVNQGTEFECEKLYADKGSVIVIDEVHKYFNCRDWQHPRNREFADWASTHRHDGFNVILVTQDLEKVDKQVRSLVGWTFVFKKIDFLGSLVTNSYMFFPYNSDDTSGKPIVSPPKHRYDKRIFSCYKSYTSSDIKEFQIGYKANILNHWVFWSIPAVLILLVVLVSRSSIASGDLFGTQKRLKDLQAKQAKSPDLHSRNTMLTSAMNNVATGKFTPPVPPYPAQRSFSTAQLPPLPPPPAQPSFPVSIPEYSRYDLDGYIDFGGGKLFAIINGISTRIPSPDVKSVSLKGKFAIAKTEIYGSPKEKSPGQRSPLNVIETQPQLSSKQPSAGVTMTSSTQPHLAVAPGRIQSIR